MNNSDVSDVVFLIVGPGEEDGYKPHAAGSRRSSKPPRKRSRYNLRSGRGGGGEDSPDDPATNPAEEGYSHEEWQYYSSLPRREKQKIASQECKLSATDGTDQSVPFRFRILRDAHMPDAVKALAARRASLLSCSSSGTESMKMHAWLDTLCRIPFGPPPAGAVLPPQQALNQVRHCLDAAVNGHDEVKHEIVRFVAQRIINPSARGRVLCLAGAPGIAKTHLARHGISRALGLPFSTIALGGANDGSFLTGHSYTYEGSRPGIIVQELIRAGRKDLVVLLDELDKVSQQRGGEEIINILMHVTDPTQNSAFRDQYLADVPIDLSQAFIVFSCNDPDLINPILRDRLTIVQMKGYSTKTKVDIFRSHLLRDVCADFGMEPEAVCIDNATVQYIIEQIPEEQGVRGLKRSVHCVLSGLVTRSLLQGEPLGSALAIDRAAVDELLSESYKRNSGAKTVPAMMYT